MKMKIKIKKNEEAASLLQAPPWYASPYWEDITLEVRPTPIHKDGMVYYLMTNDSLNYEALQEGREYLSKRAQLKLDNKQINTFFILFDYATPLNGINNRLFSFLLQKEEE